MNCYNHPLRQGTNTCSKCGNWLCDECSVEIDGRIYCRSCLSKGPEKASHEKRCPNILLLMMFSGLPGANYMYMGLIKRGLFVMTSFFLSIYVASFFNFAAFLIVGIVVTSFFDGLRIRRRLIAGLPVSDDIDDLKTFFSANKTPILGVLGLFTVVELLQKILSVSASAGRYGAMAISRHGFHPSGIVAIAAVALGVYFLTKLRTKKSAHRDDDDAQQ